MILIAGLGNPGEKYKNTRHNIGFQVIDEFSRKNNFPDFRFAKKHNADISESVMGKEKIILAKPQTFMNNSGKSIKSLNVGRPGLVVIHDDIDLPLGKIKISIGRGAAGHKGVESIIQELDPPKDLGQAKNFVRFRIGIQPQIGKPKNIETFVLQKFQENEEKIVQDIIKKTAEAIKTMLEEGIEKAMNLHNK